MTWAGRRTEPDPASCLPICLPTWHRTHRSRTGFRPSTHRGGQLLTQSTAETLHGLRGCKRRLRLRSKCSRPRPSCNDVLRRDRPHGGSRLTREVAMLGRSLSRVNLREMPVLCLQRSVACLYQFLSLLRKRGLDELHFLPVPAFELRRHQLQAPLDAPDLAGTTECQPIAAPTIAHGQPNQLKMSTIWSPPH